MNSCQTQPFFIYILVLQGLTTCFDRVCVCVCVLLFTVYVVVTQHAVNCLPLPICYCCCCCFKCNCRFPVLVSYLLAGWLAAISDLELTRGNVASDVLFRDSTLCLSTVHFIYLLHLVTTTTSPLATVNLSLPHLLSYHRHHYHFYSSLGSSLSSFRVSIYIFRHNQ